MDAKLFFDPVSEEILDESTGIYSFFQNIHINSEKVPDLSGMHIALIGLTEDRGGTAQFSEASNLIRKKLYNLKRGTGEYKIVDLGNLKICFDALVEKMNSDIGISDTDYTGPKILTLLK